MFVLSLMLSLSGTPAACQLEQVLAPQAVAAANVQGFATPLAYADGALYTLQIEEDEQDSSAVGLDTVVLRGEPSEGGGWTWQRTVLEPETMDDPWHTAGSIGVDEAGFVHVAYNMHNTPWQYAVSTRPGDISEFEFRGQAISRADKLHQTSGRGAPEAYGEYGEAAIPGAQISYPAFFNDREGRLYVSYRQTLRPARSWKNRALAGGVARYSASSGRWQALGGALALQPGDARNIPAGKPFQTSLIHQPGWTVYFIRMAFDSENGMHLSWLWRKGGPGRDSQHPSYAYSPAGSNNFYAADGRRLTLPISLKDADLPAMYTDKRKFLSQTSISVDDSDRPVILATTLDGKRVQFSYQGRAGGWQEFAAPPGAAEVIASTDRGTQEGAMQWAFASGPSVYRRPLARTTGKQGSWHKYLSRSGYCGADVLTAPEAEAFFIRTTGPGGCNSAMETIFKVPMCLETR